MVHLRDLVVDVNGSQAKLIDQPELPSWLRNGALNVDEEVTEFAVSVRWLRERPTSEAVSGRGLFASQLSACKLRDERTIEVVTTAFGLNEGTQRVTPADQ
jgi:hypothetical protein